MTFKIVVLLGLLMVPVAEAADCNLVTKNGKQFQNMSADAFQRLTVADRVLADGYSQDENDCRAAADASAICLALQQLKAGGSFEQFMAASLKSDLFTCRVGTAAQNEECVKKTLPRIVATCNSPAVKRGNGMMVSGECSRICTDVLNTQPHTTVPSPKPTARPVTAVTGRPPAPRPKPTPKPTPASTPTPTPTGTVFQSAPGVDVACVFNAQRSVITFKAKRLDGPKPAFYALYCHGKSGNYQNGRSGLPDASGWFEVAKSSTALALGTTECSAAAQIGSTTYKSAYKACTTQ